MKHILILAQDGQLLPCLGGITWGRRCDELCLYAWGGASDGVLFEFLKFT